MFSASFTVVCINVSDMQIVSSSSIMLMYIHVQFEVICKNTWQTMFMMHKFMNEQQNVQHMHIWY